MGMSNMWKSLAIVSGLLLLLTYLLIQSRSPNLALRARMQEALQTLQLHDTELTRDVLLARAGLLPDYDSLPRTGQSLSQTLGTLRAESAAVSGQAAQDMGQHVEGLAAALHQKVTLVEYFTSDNALLQNSLMYLTYAGQTLGTRVEEEPAVAADIAALSHVLLRFIHTPELSVGQEVGAALHRLSQAPLFPQDFHTLVAHGRLIVEVLPQVDTLLRQIIAVPTAAHAAAFQDAVLRYADRVEARAERFRVLLYLVAVMLLGYLLYQFAQLRANARDLRRANADLQREMGERQRAEEALHHAQAELAHVTRVATLGELTASIAHEINQPLGAVVNNASACVRWLAAQNLEEARQSAALVIADGHRAAEIIRRIRDLAKKAPLQKEWLDLNATIRDVIALARSEVHRNGVVVETHLAGDVPLILGDRVQLQQVLLNLLMNAIEAVSGLGAEPRALWVSSERVAATEVVVAVRDSGPGFDPQHLDRLFDAFYTTKPHGLGLGLAISRRIIEAHGGRLWATANAPHGAVLQFTLPIGSEEVA
jgi:signal transduction histidine kinase